ncbi:hypothetical protein DA2_1367 [Desulfovibrio sp. A2]|nr:hypothetical protein DA2_1367 [Desulfovibrio sp. A2]
MNKITNRRYNNRKHHEKIYYFSMMSEMYQTDPFSRPPRQPTVCTMLHLFIYCALFHMY